MIEPLCLLQCVHRKKQPSGLVHVGRRTIFATTAVDDVARLSKVHSLLTWRLQLRI